MSPPPWAENTQIGLLRADDLQRPDLVFRYGHYLYRTCGTHLAAGGMGTVSNMERRLDGAGEIEEVVGKTFQNSYLQQIRSDEVTRRDHHINLAAVARIAALSHPGLLPMYVSAPIADNYLFVTPRMGTTLLEATTKHRLTARARTQLLMQALDALGHLHEARLLHRDFTLRNVLLDDRAAIAYLFDFDLALSLDDVIGGTYSTHYRGRVFGSPGYSVPPETVDPGLAELPVTAALDVFAVGGALHALFTDEMPYGKVDDMWGLLMRIGDGLVIAGKSRVHYPDSVPRPLRPVIERCLEREPGARYVDVPAIIADLRAVLPELDDRSADARFFFSATVGAPVVDRSQRLQAVFNRRRDESVSRHQVEVAEAAVTTWGYEIQKCLGRVKGHPIFVAAPRVDLLAAGQFPDANTFPKLVTVIDLHQLADPRRLVDTWTQAYWPTLKKVRRGMMTTLHNVILDTETGSLLLFSEFIDDPRFGGQLAEVDLHVDGALALGFLVTRQVAPLHEHGMAHNNIHPGVLLFKAATETRMAQPAMIGLVEPSLAPEAMVSDTRALASMVLSWLRPARILALNARTRPHFDEVRARLSALATDRASLARVDELLAAVSDGLALVDFNFSVLRDAGGDLEEYAQLVLSHRAYHLLWPEHG
ncbi:MAG: protein kinase [Kofleriaceae bacterium]|nr:protein kinase [Kofleriaceae bacterium]MCL4226262.1 protein kinase [Myxococcales bacterium]